jgi:hypothetical protein
MTVVWSPDGPGGSSGDRVTDVGGVVVSSAEVAEVDGVVVVLSEPESLSPQATSEPAAIPAASVNSAEFDRTLRVVMSPVVTRLDDS